jgi:hypothetical protein
MLKVSNLNFVNSSSSGTELFNADREAQTYDKASECEWMNEWASELLFFTILAKVSKIVFKL